MIALPEAGAASPEVQQEAVAAFMETARKLGISLDGFDASASLEERLGWAKRAGLKPGAALSRFSTDLQQSTATQVLQCVRKATELRIFIPVEFLCVDEAVSGKVSRRPGLNRLRYLSEWGLIEAVSLFNLSRLYRNAMKSCLFVAENLVEEGIRCFAAAQDFDTDSSRWKLVLHIHGIVDELQLDSTSEHVRAGLGNLFRHGNTTGPTTVGYEAVEVEGPPTKRGLPRTAPRVVEKWAELIRQHAQMLLDGMSYREGLRRWRAAGGPCDARSSRGKMSYNAYRRLWTNRRLIGQWSFGEKRNDFSSKLDYTRQIPAPEADVITEYHPHLRILDDDVFYRLQAKVAAEKIGPRPARKQEGPKRANSAKRSRGDSCKVRNRKLWDIVQDIFHCEACDAPKAPSRFHVAGGNGRGMGCKNKPESCGAYSVVNRKEAVTSVCDYLATAILADAELVEQTLAYAAEANAAGDADANAEVERLDREIAQQDRKIDDLRLFAGQLEGAKRDQWLADGVRAQADLARAMQHRERLLALIRGEQAAITPEQIRACLMDMASLFRRAAAGELGEDETMEAVRLFRMLVGERILVRVEARAGRKQTVVRGIFRPQIVNAVKQSLGDPRAHHDEPPEVQVWLRKPPLRDLLAERVHELVDVDGRTTEQTVAQLDAEGHVVEAPQIWAIRKRYWEMIGQPAPRLPYNNGKPRRKKD